MTVEVAVEVADMLCRGPGCVGAFADRFAARYARAGVTPMALVVNLYREYPTDKVDLSDLDETQINKLHLLPLAASSADNILARVPQQDHKGDEEYIFDLFSYAFVPARKKDIECLLEARDRWSAESNSDDDADYDHTSDDDSIPSSDDVNIV